MITGLAPQSQAQSAPFGGQFVTLPPPKVPPEYPDAFYWDQAVQSAPESPLAQQALFLPEPPNRPPAPSSENGSSHFGAVAAIAAAALIVAGGTVALIAWRRRSKNVRSADKAGNDEASSAATKRAAQQKPLADAAGDIRSSMNALGKL